jgi:hypothetical protein
MFFMEVKLGKYLHYKGTIVEVIGTALHSETFEEMVVYLHPDPIKGKDANTMWVRPKKMFVQKLIVEGQVVPRFKFVE